MKNDYPIEFYLSLQSILRWLLRVGISVPLVRKLEVCSHSLLACSGTNQRFVTRQNFRSNYHSLEELMTKRNHDSSWGGKTNIFIYLS